MSGGHSAVDDLRRQRQLHCNFFFGFSASFDDSVEGDSERKGVQMKDKDETLGQKKSRPEGTTPVMKKEEEEKKKAAVHSRRTLYVPVESVGRIIGAKGWNIKSLQQAPGMRRITVQQEEDDGHPGNPNTTVVYMEGTPEAMDVVEANIQKTVARARRTLSRFARQKHSNRHTPGRPDSYIWTASEIHKRPVRPLPRGSNSNWYAKKKKDKKLEKERERLVSTTFRATD